MKLTIEQAREILNEQEELMDYYDDTDIEEDVKNYREALQMGADALALQEPKKPIYEHLDGLSLPVPYRCPTCGEKIATYDGFARCTIKEHHCKCGQKIDWSDEQ